MDFLIDPSFHGIKRLFDLSFNDDDDPEGHKQYSLPTVETEDYVMIDGRNFFDQPIKSDLKTYNNTWRWLYSWIFIRLSLFQKI